MAEAGSQHAAAAPERIVLTRDPHHADEISGMVAAVTALLTWWACNAFIPLFGATLANEYAAQSGLAGRRGAAARGIVEVARVELLQPRRPARRARRHSARAHDGRRTMFVCISSYSAAAAVHHLWSGAFARRPSQRFVPVGIGVYGVFSTFVFCLPELFPARLRAMGSGSATTSVASSRHSDPPWSA